MRPVDIGAIYRDARDRDLTWQEFLDELGRAIKEKQEENDAKMSELRKHDAEGRDVS